MELKYTLCQASICQKVITIFRERKLRSIQRRCCCLSSCDPVFDRMKNDIISIFRHEGLSITIEKDLIETLLDVTFNLSRGKHFPLRKVNNRSLYTNAKSNYPYTVIKKVPKMTNKILSDLSCNQEEFNKAKPLKQEILLESNYKASLEFKSL